MAEDSQKTLHHLAIHTATYPKARNIRAKSSDEPYPFIHSHLNNAVSKSQDGETMTMLIVILEELVGCTFGITNPDGQADKVKIVEAIEKHAAHTRGSPTHIQFKCSVNDNVHEEIMSYNNIMSHLECDEHTKVMWKFKNIFAHHGPFSQSHPDYNGSTYNLTMEWENGEITMEPLAIIAVDDPVSCAIYAKECDLLDVPG